MPDMQQHIADGVRVSPVFDLRMWPEAAATDTGGRGMDALNLPGAPFDHVQDRAAPLDEGLRALNSQLVARNIHIARMLWQQNNRNTDLQNILLSMDMAILCLSGDMRLRFFSDAAGTLLGVGPSDLGTTIVGSAPLSPVRHLIDDLGEVIRTGVSRECIALLSVERLHLCRMLPILTRDATPYGAIILFTAVSPGSCAETPVPEPDPEPSGPSRICNLTRRQHQIMDRVLAGQLNKNIAADLNISQRTVENHRAAIMRRTGATSLPALARMAVGAAAGDDRRADIPWLTGQTPTSEGPGHFGREMDPNPSCPGLKDRGECPV